jgi:acyl-CoA thioesterase-1
MGLHPVRSVNGPRFEQRDEKKHGRGDLPRYDPAVRIVNLLAGLILLAAGLMAPGGIAAAETTQATGTTTKILAFGDSLTAGLGLPRSLSFPARLEAALRADGFAVEVIDAGLSGDTTAGGLARIDWLLDDPPDLVIVELGANDALRGLDPTRTRANLDAILSRIRAKGCDVLLVGMRAPGNFGPDYARAFDEIYPALVRRHGVPLYPFFLDGVAMDPALNQADGLHPNARGVEVIVERIVPYVRRLLIRASPSAAVGGTGRLTGRMGKARALPLNACVQASPA